MASQFNYWFDRNPGWSDHFLVTWNQSSVRSEAWHLHCAWRYFRYTIYPKLACHNIDGVKSRNIIFESRIQSRTRIAFVSQGCVPRHVWLEFMLIQDSYKSQPQHLYLCIIRTYRHRTKSPLVHRRIRTNAKCHSTYGYLNIPEGTWAYHTYVSTSVTHVLASYVVRSLYVTVDLTVDKTDDCRTSVMFPSFYFHV